MSGNELLMYISMDLDEFMYFMDGWMDFIMI